jgi:1-acyl-sn-glycerol-3-phosphate acyltransferase
MLRTLFFYITFIPWTLFVILTGVPVSFLSPTTCMPMPASGPGQPAAGGVRLTSRGEHLPEGRHLHAEPPEQLRLLALLAGLRSVPWLARGALPIPSSALPCAAGYPHRPLDHRRRS